MVADRVRETAREGVRDVWLVAKSGPGARAGQLRTHMFKEEQMLFPHIQRLEAVVREGRPAPQAPFGTVANPDVSVSSGRFQRSHKRLAIRTKIVLTMADQPLSDQR